MRYRTARFLESYLWNRTGGVQQQERTIPDGDNGITVTLYSPRRPAVYPGWIVLHGITVVGRAHPSLQRFARALAASGAVVVVPEIARWRKLIIDPGAAPPVIAATARWLNERRDVEAGGVRLAGFSFAATHALATAARTEVRELIRSVVAFGGYCDPRATFRYAFTGEHEWEGIASRLAPDPYGRWVVTANYLTDVAEFAEMEKVAEAARKLATEAGRLRTHAGDPLYDPIKSALRQSLSAREREVWEVVAPPSGVAPLRAAARAIGTSVADAALARHPALDPRPSLSALACSIVLAHGYYDQLVPYTEALRLHRHLPATCPSSVHISRMFAHSNQVPALRLRDYPREAVGFVRLLDRVLSTR